MPVVEINAESYTKFVDASVDTFTAQCLAVDGWVVKFGPNKPADDAKGLSVAGRADAAVTRAIAPGHGWAKLPAGSLAQIAVVVVEP